MAPSFKDHPLYKLRHQLLLGDLLGVLLAVGTVLNAIYYVNTFPFMVQFTLFALCAAFCLWDLFDYHHRKVTDPDHEPAWPLRKFMYGDLAFAIIFQLAFWFLVSGPKIYPGSPFETVSGFLALWCSIQHAICFWKEMMALKHAQWLKQRPLLPCAVCGAVPQENPPSTTARTTIFQHDPNEARDLRARVYDFTPDDASESQLLVPQDYDSSYGAIGEPQLTPSTTASTSRKGKGKKTKKSVPSDDGA